MSEEQLIVSNDMFWKKFSLKRNKEVHKALPTTLLKLNGKIQQESQLSGFLAL